MKIGILTYHRAHNYGALLQAYALRSYLQQKGHKVEIIDYWPKYHSSRYMLIPGFFKMSIKTKAKRLILFCLGFGRILIRRGGYLRFIKERFDLSSTPRFRTAVSTNVTDYDLVVYGSDQIWRKQNATLFRGFDEIYFGYYPSTATKKISYAASMGVIDLHNEDLAFLKEMMNNFDYVSVRETELKQVLENISSHDISLTLDPVFLLDREKWISLIPPRKIKGRYIFLFQLISSKESIILTQMLKEYYNYKVIEIPSTNINPLLFGSRYKQTESPLEFLSLIFNAEFVISTSFHGVAFSLIFEKQFLALGMGNNSGRLLSLLSPLGLKNRYLDNINDADFKQEIDYSKVKELLKTNRENSINYLNHAIH
jgi:hypothetical protein